MPMTAQLPLPDVFEERVMEPALVVIFTLRVPLERLASMVGGCGFGPISYFSRSALISFLLHSHCDLLLIRVPSCMAKGSGSIVFFFVAPADTLQSAPVFSAEATPPPVPPVPGSLAPPVLAPPVPGFAPPSVLAPPLAARPPVLAPPMGPRPPVLVPPVAGFASPPVLAPPVPGSVPPPVPGLVTPPALELVPPLATEPPVPEPPPP